MWTRLLTLVNPLNVGHMAMWTKGVNHMAMWTIGVNHMAMWTKLLTIVQVGERREYMP